MPLYQGGQLLFLAEPIRLELAGPVINFPANDWRHYQWEWRTPLTHIWLASRYIRRSPGWTGARNVCKWPAGTFKVIHDKRIVSRLYTALETLINPPSWTILCGSNISLQNSLILHRMESNLVWTEIWYLWQSQICLPLMSQLYNKYLTRNQLSRRHLWLSVSVIVWQIGMLNKFH